MSGALKPCPKCKCDSPRFERWVNEEGPSYKTYYRPMCPACMYALDNWDEDVEKAIEFWNTRSIEDELLARAEAAEKRIAELEAERRWVPVGERLPKEGEVVLWRNEHEFLTGKVDRVRDGTPIVEVYRSMDTIHLNSKLTHWMPILPAQDAE